MASLIWTGYGLCKFARVGVLLCTLHAQAGNQAIYGEATGRFKPVIPLDVIAHGDFADAARTLLIEPVIDGTLTVDEIGPRHRIRERRLAGRLRCTSHELIRICTLDAVRARRAVGIRFTFEER